MDRHNGTSVPPSSSPADRHARQRVLPWVGRRGQRRLTESRVAVVGCGALGTPAADYLVRAGIGTVLLVDRDVIETSNLQRQTLYAAADVGRPKAVVAAERLRAVDPAADVHACVVDLDAGHVDALLWGVSLAIDATDNVATRYLLNDWAVRTSTPWVYGGCVGTQGRVMAVVPGVTPCLRCLWPQVPTGAFDTCDTAGVLGPAAGVVASLQATAAIRLLVGLPATKRLITLDLLNDRLHTLDLSDARREDCPSCGPQRVDTLNRPDGVAGPAVLCGRNAVRLRPGSGTPDAGWLNRLATRLANAGRVEGGGGWVRFTPAEPPAGVSMTLFSDGGAIVYGTDNAVVARTLHARYVGG